LYKVYLKYLYNYKIDNKLLFIEKDLLIILIKNKFDLDEKKVSDDLYVNINNLRKDNKKIDLFKKYINEYIAKQDSIIIDINDIDFVDLLFKSENVGFIYNIKDLRKIVLSIFKDQFNSYIDIEFYKTIKFYNDAIFLFDNTIPLNIYNFEKKRNEAISVKKEIDNSVEKENILDKYKKIFILPELDYTYDKYINLLKLYRLSLKENITNKSFFLEKKNKYLNVKKDINKDNFESLNKRYIELFKKINMKKYKIEDNDDKDI